jgi:hypothetical protein
MKSSHRPPTTAPARSCIPDISRPYRSISRRFRAAPIVLCLYLAAPAALGASYKWTDEQGRVHYGDTIPPADIHRPHEKLDKQGLVDRKVDAAPNPTQRAELRRRTQEQAAEQEEARRREIRDQFLIETYQDVASIDSSISLATSVVDKLTARRAALARNAAANERGGEATLKLQQGIRDIDQQLEHQRSYIEERRSERRGLEQAAVQDIARFEQLQAEQLEAQRAGNP